MGTDRAIDAPVGATALTMPWEGQLRCGEHQILQTQLFAPNHSVSGAYVWWLTVLSRRSLLSWQRVGIGRGFNNSA
jgi:hypothetical protein